MSESNGSMRFVENWQDHRLDLRTKTAVVTGGARGIGRAVTVALAREGAKAIAVVDQLDEVHTFCEKANRHFEREALIPFSGDVTNAEFRRSVFSEMRSRFGPVSICVPAAGITGDRLAVKVNRETDKVEVYPEEMFDRVMRVNLVAPIYWAMETIASVAQDRKDRGLKKWTADEGVQGCVVLIGSVSSAGNRGQISYATAKAGLEGAQATFAMEAIYHGMRCAIIHPGFTDTAMVKSLGEEYVAKHILPQTQLGRLILPEEIADAICFLACNASVSGRLWVDAGWRPTP